MAKPELTSHRKFKKLVRLLGDPRPHVIGYLECLWHQGYQIGTAFLGDADDVEAAAEYPGERGRFANAAYEAGFLDVDGHGHYLIHDLYDHAPAYAKKRMARRGSGPAEMRQKIKADVPDGCRADTKPAEVETNGNENDQTEAARQTKPKPKPRTQTQAQSENPKPKPEDRGEGPPATEPNPVRRFVPPTVGEVRDYCLGRSSRVDPEQFVDFYASKGWRVGSEAMKDWRACVRTWEKRDRERQRSPPRQLDLRDQIDSGNEFIRLTGGMPQ